MNKNNIIIMKYEGKPSVLRAINGGFHDAVKTFFVAILTSRVEPEDRNALLTEIIADLQKALSDDSFGETLQRLKEIITEMPPSAFGSTALVIALPSSRVKHPEFAAPRNCTEFFKQNLQRAFNSSSGPSLYPDK